MQIQPKEKVLNRRQKRVDRVKRKADLAQLVEDGHTEHGPTIDDVGPRARVLSVPRLGSGAHQAAKRVLKVEGKVNFFPQRQVNE